LESEDRLSVLDAPLGFRPVNDDWRLEVTPGKPEHADVLVHRLEARELEHDLSSAFHDRIVVSRNGEHVFLYAGTREQAERAREVVLDLAKQHGWSLEIDFKRWHPTAEEWEDPDKPLPTDDAARLAEHEELIAAERKQVEETGHPEFEVRIDLPSLHDAHHLAEQLRSEGLPVVHRWRYILLGATDEDNAKELAERIGNEAPSGSKVAAEGTWQAAYAERPPNPFAVLGGLAG
jgi:hypothetical protein